MRYYYEEGNIYLNKNQGRVNNPVFYSQQKLAEQAGLSYNVITKIEQGAAEHPTLKTLLKLADAFGISLDVLVGRK